MSYVELHACSAFSFLRGGSFPEHIAATAASLGMPAVALLDRNGVYGAQRFSVAARENGKCSVRWNELPNHSEGLVAFLGGALVSSAGDDVSSSRTFKRSLRRDA